MRGDVCEELGILDFCTNLSNTFFWISSTYEYSITCCGLIMDGESMTRLLDAVILCLAS